MPQFYLVTFGKALEETTVSSYAELDSTQVYIIVVDQEQIMYIWRGSDAPNRMKFISSRAAAQLRVDQGGTHSVQSVDQGQEPPNFHNLFGDQSLPKPTHPPTLAGEMLGALDDFKDSHTDENITDHEEKFVESISDMKTPESDEIYNVEPITSVEDVPELSEVEDVPEQEYIDTDKITDSVDQSISYEDPNQESVPTESITSDNGSIMKPEAFMDAERLLESLNFESSENDNIQIQESANTKSSIKPEFPGVPKKTTIDMTSQEDTKIIHSDETELTSLEVPSPEVPLEVPSPEVPLEVPSPEVPLEVPSPNIRLEVPLPEIPPEVPPEIPPEVPPEIPPELITTVAPAINESLEKTLKEYPIPDGYNREFIISQNKLYTIVRKEIQLLGVREERFEPLRDPPEGSHLVHGYLIRLIVRNGSVLAVEFLRSKETSRKPESEASVTSEAPSGEAHTEKTRSELLSAMQREVKEFHP